MNDDTRAGRDDKSGHSASAGEGSDGDSSPKTGVTVCETEAGPAANDQSDEARVAALEKDVGHLKDQLLRALAEGENQRRRAQRERDEAVKYAATGLARDLLTVSDNLRRALDAVPTGATESNELLKMLETGVELVERELLAAFEKHGIRKITPQGERFDPNFHQAMFEVPGTEHPTGTIVQVMQPGYALGDRLLRPALVGVAKSPPEQSGTRPVDTTV
jgi:molecular chaperone GrpE